MISIDPQKASMLAALLLLGCIPVLQACTTSPTDALNLTNPLVPPNEPLPADQPGVKKTGKFPTFGNPPQRATKQLSEAEKAEIKSSLGAVAKRNDAKSPGRTQAEYQREVSEMQRLIEQQKRKRRAQ